MWLAAIAAKAVKEVAYHASFANEWMIRLGDGTAESRGRIERGLDWNWRFVDELFDADDAAATLVAGGVAPDLAVLRGAWDERIGATLARATLSAPKPHRAAMGGRRGHHSEHLGHLLSNMQFLPRAYPGATW